MSPFLLIIAASVTEGDSIFNNPTIIAIFTGLLSGGILTAFTTYWVARRKTPYEIDSIIAAGAETVVTSMERALTAEKHRADRAEERNAELRAEIARRDARIQRLEDRLDELQEALDQARDELHSILTDDRKKR